MQRTNLDKKMLMQSVKFNNQDTGDAYNSIVFIQILISNNS